MVALTMSLQVGIDTKIQGQLFVLPSESLDVSREAIGSIEESFCITSRSLQKTPRQHPHSPTYSAL